MIGLFLITHSSYGESLIQCACHVLNSRPVQMAQLGVSGQDDPLDLLPLARRWLSVVDSGEGVLLLTDIFGATPSNLALKLCEPGKVEAVAGVNLPMLLRTLTYREREIIKLRYGIGDGYTYTLEEVGRIFKVTRERVRQVEAKAIRKLQHPVRARKLEGFLPGGVTR